MKFVWRSGRCLWERPATLLSPAARSARTWRQKFANCVLADVGLALAAIPFDVGVTEARVVVSVHYTKDEGGLGKYSWDLLLKRAGDRWVFERVLFVLT